MPSTREMRLRIRSVKNLAQVTKALETVSASKVRRSIKAANDTKPYSEKAWKVLVHLARQPGHNALHPLLKEREDVKKILVILISTDRGSVGALNANILRETLLRFNPAPVPVEYIAVGRKGRDLLMRRSRKVVADFSNLALAPSFMDVSAIGRMAVDDYLTGKADQVWIAYTDFINMVVQRPVIRQLLPLKVEFGGEDQHGYNVTHHQSSAVFTYEPDQDEILDQIVPRFTALQVYQAILSGQASEHAARMVAMRNATENANELIEGLQLQYNKLRQNIITNDMLDITGGAEALEQSGH